MIIVADIKKEENESTTIAHVAVRGRIGVSISGREFAEHVAFPGNDKIPSPTCRWKRWSRGA